MSRWTSAPVVADTTPTRCTTIPARRTMRSNASLARSVGEGVPLAADEEEAAQLAPVRLEEERLNAGDLPLLLELG